MKNICFFNTIRFWGGGEKLHLENAIEFGVKGYQVQILAGKKSVLLEKAQHLNLSTHSFTIRNLSFMNPVKIYLLVKYFKKQRIDTVFFSSYQDVKIGSFAAKIAGVKRIVYLRGLAKVVKGGLINKFIFGRLLTHIIANSEETKRNILENMKATIPKEKVKIIYHGIHHSIDDPRLLAGFKHKDSNSKGKVIGNAGRLTSQKGQKYLIELATLLKTRKLNFQIQIAGAGELYDELAEMIEKNDLSNEVKLLGFVEDMHSFMKGLDIFVLTSLFEGFGFVLVEAMMHSLPVVCFNLSSNPEIVSDQKTGYLITYPDMEDFANRVESLLNDKELMTQFGKNGYERALKHFRFKDRHDELENYLLQ